MNTTVTGVRFETADPLLARLVPQAEKKCLTNIKDFGPDKVLVELSLIHISEPTRPY